LAAFSAAPHRRRLDRSRPRLADQGGGTHAACVGRDAAALDPRPERAGQ
jgi:hypothetical protein